MPRFSRRTKRRYGRKPYARKRRPRTYGLRKRRFGRNVLTRSVNPAVQVPHIWRLRYNEQIQISTTALGNIGIHVFAANSIYDPDVTGSGHQPLLHDQLATFWTRYTVIGSRIRVKAVASSSSNAGGQLLGIVLDDNANFQNEPSTIIENAKGPYRYINQNINTSSRSVNLSHTFSAKKFFGKRNPIDDDLISSDFSNNPSNSAYFIIWTQTPNLASTSTLSLSVVIDYIVYCHEPKDVAQS